MNPNYCSSCPQLGAPPSRSRPDYFPFLFRHVPAPSNRFCAGLFHLPHLIFPTSISASFRRSFRPPFMPVLSSALLTGLHPTAFAPGPLSSSLLFSPPPALRAGLLLALPPGALPSALPAPALSPSRLVPLPFWPPSSSLAPIFGTAFSERPRCGP